MQVYVMYFASLLVLDMKQVTFHTITSVLYPLSFFETPVRLYHKKRHPGVLTISFFLSTYYYQVKSEIFRNNQ